MNAKLLGAAFTALAVVTLAGTPTAAQWRDTRGTAPYDAGYRDGSRAGTDDARDARAYEYRRHRDYRAADSGYDSRDGGRDAYKDQYRSGFVAGYRDGFYGGRGGRAGVQPRPEYGGPGVFGRGPGGGAYGGRAPGLEIARSNGFERGYQRGRDDARDRDRPGPWRYKEYRNAVQGYRGEYGPKALYQEAYRAGFERGYEAGYRESRRGGHRY